MQATGKLVALVRELAPGMQLGQDNLDSGNTLFWMNIHRHAATVITDLDRTILVEF